MAQARHRASPASASWVEQVEKEELAAARRAALLRKLKLPAEPKAKESGFAPSTSRKNNGRGAKNTRGSTRGRGSARGARGGARGGAKGSTRTPKTKKKTTSQSTETSNDSDESEIDATAPIMSQIRHAIAKTSKNSGMAPDGTVMAVNQTIKDDEGRAPEPVPAPNFTIQDLMPDGYKDQVDRNPSMVANLPTKQSFVEFVLIQRSLEIGSNGRPKGVGVPDPQVFKDLVVDAIILTFRENSNWCNVVHSDFVTRHGVCVIILDYGYPEGAERFRSNIIALSLDNVEYNTYPAADLLKKICCHRFLPFRL